MFQEHVVDRTIGIFDGNSKCDQNFELQQVGKSLRSIANRFHGWIYREGLKNRKAKEHEWENKRILLLILYNIRMNRFLTEMANETSSIKHCSLRLVNTLFFYTFSSTIFNGGVKTQFIKILNGSWCIDFNSLTGEMPLLYSRMIFKGHPRWKHHE